MASCCKCNCPIEDPGDRDYRYVCSYCRKVACNTHAKEVFSIIRCKKEQKEYRSYICYECDLELDAYYEGVYEDPY